MGPYRSVILIAGILFVLINPLSFGQSSYTDGYIISNGQDTIYGKINSGSDIRNSRICRFKTGSELKEYLPSQISGYGLINGKFYTSQVVRDSFAEVLVAGELSLYKSGTHFIIKKSGIESGILESEESKKTINGKTVFVKDTRWKGIISLLTSDCPEISNELSDLTLDKGSLVRFVTTYNICRRAPYIEYQSEKRWTKLEYGVSAGLTLNSINFSYKGHEFDYCEGKFNSLDPSVGLLLTVSSPRINEKIALQTEINFSKSHFYSFVKTQQFSSTAYHDTFIDLTTLSVPVSIRYLLSDSYYKVFLNAGVAPAFNLEAGTKAISEYQDDNTVERVTREAFEVNRLHTGFWGGIGFLKPLKRFQLGAVLNYNHLFRLSETRGLTADMNKLSFSVIIITK